MTVVNLSYPKFRYELSTGVPAAGYKLFTYEEGTSTKKTTWTSLAKTAANTNPIVLDANGEADVWLDGNYKLVLAPSNDTDPPASPIWTVDNVRSSDLSTSSTSNVTTIPINGSFETDTDSDNVPDNWTVAELTGGTIAIDSTSSTHGANSLKFTSTGSGGGSASTDDYYEVEAGKVIGLRFSIISANADTHNSVDVYWYNASKVYLSASSAYDDSATNPTSWTRKYTTVTAPATAKFARIVLSGVEADSTTHSSTTFDNIELDTEFTGEITAESTALNYTANLTSDAQTQLDNLVTDISETAGRRGALVYHSTGQTVAAGGGNLAFDSEDYDTDTIHDTVTNNDRLTVPTGVSKVRLSFSAITSSTVADGFVRGEVRKNGASFTGLVSSLSNFTSTATAFSISGTTPVLSVSPGDYFTVYAVETSSGVVTTTTSGFWFAMEIIQ